jgi:hypothetical protein
MFTLLALLLTLHCPITNTVDAELIYETAQSHRDLFINLRHQYNDGANLEDVSTAAIACVKGIYGAILPFMDATGSITNESALRQLLLRKSGYYLLTSARIDLERWDIKLFADEMRKKLASKDNNIHPSTVQLLIECDQLYIKLTSFNEYALKIYSQYSFEEQLETLRKKADAHFKNLLALACKSDKEVMDQITTQDIIVLKFMFGFIAAYQQQIVNACDLYRKESHDMFNPTVYAKAKTLQNHLATISKTIQANAALMKLMFDCSK